LLEAEIVEKNPSSIWGPCLHAEKCPLAEGRDWCHFSVPVQIPGQWFRQISEGLSSERQWVKFSYLWLSSQDRRAPLPSREVRLVVSDPLRPHSGPESQKTRGQTEFVLLCEPERPGRLAVPRGQKLRRGDLVRTPR
jgi:hypothetical protein